MRNAIMFCYIVKRTCKQQARMLQGTTKINSNINQFGLLRTENKESGASLLKSTLSNIYDNDDECKCD